MDKFKFYSNGDPWCDCWKCLSCNDYDTYQDIINGEMFVICYDCKESQKLSDLENKEYKITCSVCGNKEILKTDKSYVNLTVYCKCSNCGSESMININ